MKNSIVMFIFLYLRPKAYFFLLNFFPKIIKIVSLSWNLESRLNWICRIRWQFSFFYFGNTLFDENSILRGNLVLNLEINFLIFFSLRTFFFYHLTIPSLFSPLPLILLIIGETFQPEFETIYLCWLFCDVAKGVNRL